MIKSKPDQNSEVQSSVLDTWGPFSVSLAPRGLGSCASLSLQSSTHSLSTRPTRRRAALFYGCCCLWWLSHAPGISYTLGSPQLHCHQWPGLSCGTPSLSYGSSPQLLSMTPSVLGFPPQLRQPLHQWPLTVPGLSCFPWLTSKPVTHGRVLKSSAASMRCWALWDYCFCVLSLRKQGQMISLHWCLSLRKHC